MIVSLNWLKKYIDCDFSPAQLAENLTLAGLEVENTYITSQEIKNIVVGEVTKVEKHPNADKLLVCKVNLGKNEVSVICGAENVRESQRVPVAVKGSVLPNGNVIKKVNIRGITSEGMICSERELGISDNHDEIMVLPKSEYKVGEEFKKESSADIIFNIDVTPNRPDCLSHLGIAREIGVIADTKLHKPDTIVNESKKSADNFIKINIHDPEACPRYSARIIRDIVIKDSPQWLKDHLLSVGIRSINNVVDITNFVLIETGHPLHAFDYDLIEGPEINVRKASPQEKFITLDNVERSLQDNDLLICDSKKSIALAGIMGGYNSEISDNTTNILIESAYFDPLTIRKTSKRLALFTESSQRFERGADPNNTIYALDRAAQLLQKYAQGTVEKGVVDVYPQEITCKKIKLRFSRIHQIIGQEIPKNNIIKILKGLELSVTEQKQDYIVVEIPTFRPDLEKECDLIEEIVRHYGYNNIISNMYSNIYLDYQKDVYSDSIKALKDFFVGQGFFETISNTLVSEKHIEVLNKNNVVQIENPLSPETTFLRNSCIPSLLDTIQWNINRSINDLRLFEIGRKFFNRQQSLPDEKTDIVGAITGYKKRIPLWNKDKNKNVNFYHLKGFIEALFDYFHIYNYIIKPYKTSFFENECSFGIYLNKKITGYMGKISSNIQERWELEQDIYIFEIDLEDFIYNSKKELIYSKITKFPLINRDLSIIINEDILSGDLTEYIKRTGGKYLNQVEIFDIYQGKGIPEGKKSITFNLKFLSTKKTLTEDEINPMFNTIIRSLEQKFSASLRT